MGFTILYFAIICIYFLAIFLLDLSHLKLKNDSINVLNNIYYKDTCLAAAVTYLREEIFNNKTEIIQTMGGLSAMDAVNLVCGPK